MAGAPAQTPAAARRAFAGLDRINLEGLRFRLVDAEGLTVGRLAAQLALVLQGKDKPTFSPNRDGGDVCVVVNADKLVLTGKKWDQKVYRWHTGYPGGLKEITARELWRRDPTQILTRAVEGMLPKNNLRPDRLRKLRVFRGPDHPFDGLALVPWAMPPRQLQESRMAWALPAGFAAMNPEAYARRMRGARHVAGALPAPEQQQQQQQQQQGGEDGEGQRQAGRRQREWRPPVIGFDDLLAADEREFVERCRQRGAAGGRSR